MIGIAVTNGFLWFIIYSMIGWAYESLLCSFTAKMPVNRGFLAGPICPIYGAGALTLVVAFGRAQLHPALLFLLCAAVTTALEYITSWAMEKLFHARWWDYTGHFLNINGRVCLMGFVAFGVLGVLVVDFVHPWLTVLTAMIPINVRFFINLVLLVLLVIDVAVTLHVVTFLSEKLNDITRAISEKLPDIVPEFLLNFSKTQSRQLRRLTRAFPHLTFPSYREQWSRVKNALTKPRQKD